MVNFTYLKYVTVFISILGVSSLSTDQTDRQIHANIHVKFVGEGHKISQWPERIQIKRKLRNDVFAVYITSVGNSFCKLTI